MTTLVRVEANRGWPVDVSMLDPKTGEALAGYPKQRVPSNSERAFYVSSGVDLLIREVQPTTIAVEG